MRIEILFGLIIVLSNGSTADDFDVLAMKFTDIFNEVRCHVAREENITSMHKLYFDSTWCGKKFSDIKSVKFYDSYRWASYNESDKTSSYIKLRENYSKKSKEAQKKRLEEGNNHPISELEHLVPFQTHVCCSKWKTLIDGDVLCIFSPEGKFNSFDYKTCKEKYVWKNNCLCEYSQPVVIPTNSPDVPSTTKEPAPPPTTSPTPSDVYIPPNLPSSTNSPEEVSSRAPIPSDPPVIRRPAPPKQTKEDADLERRLKKYLAEETDGDEPDEEKDEEYYYDYDSCSSFSIVVPFVFVMLEVTRIPLVYLRPTENPDLEKRLKKYLAEETDGDEPDDGEGRRILL
uniref:DUF4789 domain-containing protein n=1 Tax=Caenorhabditis tropicalis TaxID=1561998 RepID=A0A1I7T1I8_9PELO